jgi:hypothetical protein
MVVLVILTDIENILAEIKDYDEMKYVWKSWRDASGKPIRELYNQFADLSNKAAKINGI